MLGLGWILVWVGFVWLVLDLFYIFNNLGRANRNWRDDVSPDHISRFQSQDGSQEFTKDPYTGGAGGAPAAPNPIAGLTPAAQFAYPHQAPQVNYTGSPNLPNIPATIPERQQQWFEHDKHQGGDISEKA
jgi:hypothetical protein